MRYTRIAIHSKLGDDLVRQSDGVCIGSKIAPFLSEVYLNTLDCVGTKLLEKGKDNLYIGRYVDDIFICATHEELWVETRSFLANSCTELTITPERPVDGELAFPDLVFTETTLC